MEAQMLDEFLNNLLTIVNQETKNNFNGILVNYYENGNNYRSHSDDESELGNNGVVTISYGSTRKFRIRDKNTKKIFKDIEISNGDMVHMGEISKEFLHEIPIQRKIIEPRYSFTFRRHL